MNEVFSFSTSCSSHSGTFVTQSLRLLLFVEAAQFLDIDFYVQNQLCNTVYVIPSGHKYVVKASAANTFYIVDIDEAALDRSLRFALMQIKMIPQKQLHINQSADVQAVIKSICTEPSLKPRLLDVFLQHLRTALAPLIQFPFHLHRFQSAECFLHHLEHCTANDSLDDIAQKMGCSLRTLQRVCAHCFDCTPQQLFNHSLLNRGIRLLLLQNQSVSQTAQLLGYTQYNSFSKFIKAHTQLSPTRLKRYLAPLFGMNCV